MSAESSQSASRSRTLNARDAFMVSMWKLVEYLGLAAYILYFPRVMSLAEFGKLAVVVAITSLFWIASSLGAQSVFGRFFPEYLENKQLLRLRILYSQMCLSRLLFIVVLAGFFPWLLQFFLPGLSVEETALATAVFVLGAVNGLFYQLQFGLNRLARWIVRDSAGKLLLVLMAVSAAMQPGLQQVLQWMLLIEAGFFVLGLYWSWRYFYVGAGLLQMDSLFTGLKFGLTFFFSNLLLLAIWRGGEMMLARLSPDDALVAVAQFSVANSITYTFYGLFAQLSVLLVPSLTAFFLRGEVARKQVWLAMLLKYVSMVVLAVMLAVCFAGDELIQLVFGDQYRQAAPLLLVLLAALIPMMVVRVAMTLAMVRKNLPVIFAITLPAFVGFIVSGVPLTLHYGAIGTAVALVIAASAGAFAALWRFDLWRLIREACLLRQLALAMLVFAATLQIDSTAWWSLGQALLLFVAGAIGMGVLSVQEIRTMLQSRRNSGELD